MGNMHFPNEPIIILEITIFPIIYHVNFAVLYFILYLIKFFKVVEKLNKN